MRCPGAQSLVVIYNHSDPTIIIPTPLEAIRHVPRRAHLNERVSRSGISGCALLFRFRPPRGEEQAPSRPAARSVWGCQILEHPLRERLRDWLSRSSRPAVEMRTNGGSDRCGQGLETVELQVQPQSCRVCSRSAGNQKKNGTKSTLYRPSMQKNGK